MGDRYEIKEKIGQGGLGAVYLAIDTQLKREVALKRLLPPGEGESGGATPENLLTEATTLSSLQHPNIVTVYDVGQDEKGAFVVMELVKGETFDVTVERGALTERDFRNVVAQTMEALVAAHHNDIVHRDLKPSNLMVNWLPSGKFQIKILDFGLAKFGKTPQIQTVDQGDAILGSIYFMAPEQFERVPLDPRTDLYSMGALYHYCLTGQYPFNGETAPQVMAAHLQNRVQSLRELRPDLPQWMADWVMWLISRDMDDRPASAKQALDYFNEEKAGLKYAAPPPPAASPLVAARGGALTTPLAAAAPPPGGIPAAQHTGPLTTQITPGVPTPGIPGMPAQAQARRYPVPIWAMIAIPILLIAILVVYLTKSGAKRKIDERNEMVLALSEAETPRGDAAIVAAFVDFIKDQEKDSTGQNNVVGALTTLRRMKGETPTEIDDALLGSVDNVPSRYRAGLLSVLIDRGATRALPTLLKNVDHKDATVSDIAIYGLGVLGGGENIGTLLKELENPASDKIAKALETAIADITLKGADIETRSTPVLRALRDAPTDEYRYALLRILGNLGGDAAWAELEEALSGSDLSARKAALSGMMGWPDGKPAERLYQMALSESDGVVRGLAFRALVVLIGSSSSVPEETRVGWIGELLKAGNLTQKSRRDLIGSLASMSTAAATEFAETLRDDPSLGRYTDLVIEEVGERMKKLASVEGAGGKVLKTADAFVFGESDFKYQPEAAAVIGWTELGYYVVWPVKFSAAGDFTVVVKAATPNGGGGDYVLTLAGERLVGSTPKGDRFVEMEIGEVKIANPGTYRLTVVGQRAEIPGNPLMQLRSVELKPK